jgi:preprotein translocase subunit SecG
MSRTGTTSKDGGNFFQARQTNRGIGTLQAKTIFLFQILWLAFSLLIRLIWKRTGGAPP